MTASNAAVRAFDAIFGALYEGDPSRYATPDILCEDRRLGFQSSGRGTAPFMKNMRALRDTGFRVASTSVLATRSDRHALVRALFVSGNDFDVEVLARVSCNEDGLMSSYAVFDASALEEAFDDLDEAYGSDEGKPFAELLEVGRRQRAALTTGDWELYRSTISDDVVLVDHRSVSLGEVRGADAVITATRAFFDLVRHPTTRIVALHAITPEAVLAEQVGMGETADGGPVESHLLRMQRLRDGRFVRIELFGADDLDAALDVFRTPSQI